MADPAVGRRGSRLRWVQNRGAARALETGYQPARRRMSRLAETRPAVASCRVVDKPSTEQSHHLRSIVTKCARPTGTRLRKNWIVAGTLYRRDKDIDATKTRLCRGLKCRATLDSSGTAVPHGTSRPLLSSSNSSSACLRIAATGAMIRKSSTCIRKSLVWRAGLITGNRICSVS